MEPDSEGRAGRRGQRGGTPGRAGLTEKRARGEGLFPWGRTLAGRGVARATQPQYAS